jgi:predicted transcriptional regulator
MTVALLAERQSGSADDAVGALPSLTFLFLLALHLTSPQPPLYDFVIQEVPMKHSRVPVTVSLPSNLAENFDRLAKAEAKNKSQLFREMLTVYEQRRREEQFHELQRYGAKKARKKSVLTEADVEKLVFQGR